MQNEEQKNNVIKTIDCTPTWLSLMPLYLELLENGDNKESKEMIKSEIKRMALIADTYVLSQKAGKVLPIAKLKKLKT